MKILNFEIEIFKKKNGIKTEVMRFNHYCAPKLYKITDNVKSLEI